jgi:hypothetical protein
MTTVARSSILTDELRITIERELSTGAALPVVCQRTGVKARSVDRWLRDGKVVRRRLERVPAPVQAADVTEPELVGAISDAAERGSWRAAAWLLERSSPERWVKPSSRPTPTPERLDDAERDPIAEIIDLAKRRRE